MDPPETWLIKVFYFQPIRVGDSRFKIAPLELFHLTCAFPIFEKPFSPNLARSHLPAKLSRIFRFFFPLPSFLDRDRKALKEIQRWKNIFFLPIQLGGCIEILFSFFFFFHCYHSSVPHHPIYRNVSEKMEEKRIGRKPPDNTRKPIRDNPRSIDIISIVLYAIKTIVDVINIRGYS